MRFGWKYDNPGPASYAASLSTVEKVLAGLNLGVDAFGRWSFTNRGDLDGQFQLVRTWNRKEWEYLRKVEPEPVPYYTYGLLTRLSAKRSTVLQTIVSGADDILAATLASPGGNLTVYLLNKSDSHRSIDIRLAPLEQPRVLHHYRVTEAAILDPEFRLEPSDHTELNDAHPGLRLDLLPSSMAALSTYELKAEDPGVILDSQVATKR